MTYMSAYYVYIISSLSHPDHCYVGITNNLSHRILCHNGVLKGGAKATRKYKDWNYVATHLCDSMSDALKLEYKVKQCRGIVARMDFLKKQ